MQYEEAVRLLSDPQLNPEALAEITDRFPNLRSSVALHPQLYPELRQWLSDLEDPVIDAALAAALLRPQSARLAPPPPPPPRKWDQPAAPKPAGRRWWPLALAAVLALILAGGAIYWIMPGKGAAPYGSEAAITAGEKLANRLAKQDGEVTSRQTVAAPQLFYYTGHADDIAETEDEDLFFVNQLIVETADAASLQTAEAVAEEVGGRVVGVNEPLGSYQLLLDQPHSVDQMVALVEEVAEREGVDHAEPNLLDEMKPTGSSDYGNNWADQWGFERGEGNWGMQTLGAPALWEADLELAEVTVGIVDAFYRGHWHADLPPVDLADQFIPLEGLVVDYEDSEAYASEIEDGETTEAGIYWREEFKRERSSSDHGLHVAGTIAAKPGAGVRGVAPNVRFVVASPATLRYTRTSATKEGGKKVADTYAINSCLTFVAEENPRVVNMSLGQSGDRGPKAFEPIEKNLGERIFQGGSHYYYEDGYAQTLEKLFEGEGDEAGPDFLVVKAAGNNACTQLAVDNLPASCTDDEQVGCSKDRRCWEVGAPDVAEEEAGGLKARAATRTPVATRLLTVGAACRPAADLDKEGNPTSYRTGLEVGGFSNAGADVLAPGCDIESTGNRDDDGKLASNTHKPMSGTSMAAPHVTGLAAVLFGINPDLTASEVQKIIIETANPTPVLSWNQSGQPDREGRLLDGAPLVNGAAAAQVAMLTRDMGSSHTWNAISGSTFRTNGGENLPVQLLGTWCAPDALGPNPPKTSCMNLATLLGERNFKLEHSEDGEVLIPVDPTGRTTTASKFTLCEGDCEDSDVLYELTYYPPGAPWECMLDETAVGCPADPTAKAGAHDISLPRLVHTYRHQHADGALETFQSEPYILNLDVPADEWHKYGDLPLPESISLVPAQLRGTWCTDAVSAGLYNDKYGSVTVPRCIDFEEWLTEDPARHGRPYYSQDAEWGAIPNPGRDGAFTTCEEGSGGSARCLAWWYMAAGVDRRCEEPGVQGTDGHCDPDGPCSTTAVSCISDMAGWPSDVVRPGEVERDRLRLVWDARGHSWPPFGPVYFRQDN